MPSPDTSSLASATRPLRVLVLGAAGFIGRHVGSRLAATLSIHPLAGDCELVLADSRSIGPEPAGVRVQCVQGDVCDPHFLAELFAQDFTTVYHLAASLTLEAEADFEHGLQVNVQALIALLQRCRAQVHAPRFVFASSISTFGGALPETVNDDVAQTPQTSYGTHKAIAELLINDCSRRGFIDGRVLRLPVVLTHPGPASGSVSDRIAALIREPLAGHDAVCPLSGDTRVPVASVQNVARSLIALADVPADAFGSTRALNLPSLSVTPLQLVDAVMRAGATGHIHWQPYAQFQRIVDGWPRAFTSQRALALGLAADASVDHLVRAHQETLHAGR
jgi:nucleoside-diphosphate-sugar epimerase